MYDPENDQFGEIGALFFTLCYFGDFTMKSISLQYFVAEKLYKTEEKGNFGDEISPIIVQNLIGSDYDLRYNDDTCDERLLVIGSLLHMPDQMITSLARVLELRDNNKLSELNVCAVR